MPLQGAFRTNLRSTHGGATLHQRCLMAGCGVGDAFDITMAPHPAPKMRSRYSTFAGSQRATRTVRAANWHWCVPFTDRQCGSSRLTHH